MKNLFVRTIELACFVLGPVFVVVSLLGFGQDYNNGSYSQTRTDIYFVGVGVGLIAFGFLRRYWSKKSADK